MSIFAKTQKNNVQYCTLLYSTVRCVQHIVQYVKYAQYVEWNEFPEEQMQLQTIIEAQWNYFRIWSSEVDLFARIQFLRDQMAEVQEDRE